MPGNPAPYGRMGRKNPSFGPGYARFAAERLTQWTIRPAWPRRSVRSWTPGRARGRKSLFFLMWSRSHPHRVNTRHERREPHMRRKAMAAALAATTFFGLAACGGVAAVSPPPAQLSGHRPDHPGPGQGHLGLRPGRPRRLEQGAPGREGAADRAAAGRRLAAPEDDPERPDQVRRVRRARSSTWCGPRSSRPTG